MPSKNEAAVEQQPICHIVTPVGMVGYGLEETDMCEALEKLAGDGIPTALICDSGSTDSGPKKLATGDMSAPHSAYKRDLTKLLRAVRRFNVPLLIGSAGGAGTNQHVDTLTEIAEEWSKEQKHPLKLVHIYSEISKALVSKRLEENRISGCGSAVPHMQRVDIDECPLIVAQMGPEAYLEAIKQQPDFNVIIGGRAYDPAPYVAFAITCLSEEDPSFDPAKSTASQQLGGIWHISKIMECGGQCATPKTRGAVCTIYADGSFDVAPIDTARCTPLSVAAHTLYEKSRPDIHYGPGGWLDLNKSQYEHQSDEKTVRVRGSIFHSSLSNGKPYQVKLEAARNIGFRSIYMGSHKDPALTSQIDSLLVRAKEYVANQVAGLEDGDWDLEYHVYGREEPNEKPKSLFIIGESRAKTQELANAIVSTSRIASVHAPYPGQKATSGNFAFGIGGAAEIPLGPCSAFCIYHLMDLDAGEETSLFKIVARVNTYDAAANGLSHTNGMPNGDDPKRVVKQAASRQPLPASVKSTGLRDARTINDIAQVLRSKNAGPYEITFDIMFDREDVYGAVKASNILNAELIARLYELDAKDVIWNGFFDQALAFKATIPRRRRGVPAASGGYFEDDVHGSQMYIPLLSVELTEELRQKLKALN